MCKWSNTRAIDLLGHLRIVAVYAKVKIFYRTTGLVKEDILPDLIPFYQTDKFWTHQQRKATFHGVVFNVFSSKNNLHMMIFLRKFN